MEGGRFKLGVAPWDQMTLVTIQRVQGAHHLCGEIGAFLVCRGIKQVNSQFLKRCNMSTNHTETLYSFGQATDHFQIH